METEYQYILLVVPLPNYRKGVRLLSHGCNITLNRTWITVGSYGELYVLAGPWGGPDVAPVLMPWESSLAYGVVCANTI